MSAVEGMLKMMSESSARGLRLAVGSPARIMDANGSPVDASSSPLTRQEILQLIGPIVPEQARRRLPQETSVDFDYASSTSGAYKVTILRNGSEIAVSFVPEPDAPAAPAAEPAAAAVQNKPAPARAAAPPAVAAAPGAH